MDGCHSFLLVSILLNILPISFMGSLCAQTKMIVCEQLSGMNGSSADSIVNYRIGEVTVSEYYQDPEIRSSTPFQSLDRKSIQEVNSLQVSDAVKFFSGVMVKDYGGIGGMKTVSVRSMGAQHTAVSYDGIIVADCQTGQVDIGRYSLENVDLLSLDIGDGNMIFQPARMFASSGLLSIKTRRPVFNDGESYHGKVGIKAGSFGLINPNVLLERKVSSTFDLNFSAEVLETKGDYPYKLFYGEGRDSYTKEFRTNNGVKTYKLESNLFGHFKEGQNLEIKSCYYKSDRGLPGAVILYNPYSSQRLWDKNAFVQAHYQQDLSPRIIFQANGKYNWSYEHYLNPDYLGSTGKEDYEYNQDELYLSSSLLYKAFQKLSFAFSADGAVNRMSSDLYDFAFPSRYSGLACFSAKYVNNWMNVTSGLLATFIHEETGSSTAAAATDYKHLSPAFNISVKPLSDMDMRLRGFYKASFRMPSFNDLYYSAIGNTGLIPEKSKQLNLGITYGYSFGGGMPHVMLSADVYHNWITDKIMAVPTKNIFIWSMMNLGKVDIEGLDLALEAIQSLGKGYELSINLNHSYQRALDVTDQTSKEYRNQIAYVPRISGSCRLALATPWVKLAYGMLYSGHRYVTGQNLAENDLPGYTDHSFSAERGLEVCRLHLVIRAEALNLLNENYEVVRNFPMPGRSYRLGLKVEF